MTTLCEALPNNSVSRLHASRCDHAAPLRSLAVDVVGEFLRRATQHVDALLLQRLNHIARLERVVDDARELVDDVGRRAGGRHQAAPDTGVEALEASLLHGGQVWRNTRAFEPG